MRGRAVGLILGAALLVPFVQPSGIEATPTCAVFPSVVATGTPITVTVAVGRKDAPYGWFMVFDTGATTRQGVSSMDLGPAYGDNGSYMLDWNRTTGVAHFRLFAQADPGYHRVTAEYRKVFAACSYTVT
jgi:hypothetical protein